VSEDAALVRTEPPDGVAPPEDPDATLRAVRTSVRGLLEGMPGYRQASPAARKRVARELVGLAMTAADLFAEDIAMTRAANAGAEVRAPLASTQAIGDTGRAGAQVLRETRDAIDFPTFVESLITGVFRAISNANVSQFERFSSLIDNVSASTAEFSRTVPEGSARQWITQRVAGLRIADGRLQVADGQDFEELRPQLRQALDASASEISRVQDDELDGTLLPLVRRKIARDRQTMLATMINMGLQRVVVDDGRLHASMDLRVDTRAVQERLAERSTEVQVNAGASGGFRGPGWGAQAYVDTSVAHVRADSEYTQDELRSQAGLRSSVDLAFRTEQVPLDRLANESQRVRITAQAPTPVALTPMTPTTGRLTQRQPQARATPPPGSQQRVRLTDVPPGRGENASEEGGSEEGGSEEGGSEEGGSEEGGSEEGGSGGNT
jgi:hypothetical protein